MAGKRGTSLKTVVNEALREGLRTMKQPTAQARYRTVTRPLGILPGIDPYKLGQAVDEIEDARKMARGNDPR